jgi:hypothetical protein
MATPPPRYEPDTTPRQTPGEVTEGKDGHFHARERVPGEWGQTPEPGNPTADFQEGTLSHKSWVKESLVPFPHALPYTVKRNPRTRD